MSKPIALIDLEGVLFPEMWPAIAEAVGVQDLAITTREVTDYRALMAQRLNLLRSNSVTMAEVQEIVSRLPFLPGAKKFIKALKAFADVTIITDSFAPMNGAALDALSVSQVYTNQFAIDHDGFACDCFYWHQGEGKARIYDCLGDRRAPVMAMGDGFNDLGMLRRADLGVLFDPSDLTLQSAGDLKVLRDLSDVLSAFEACASGSVMALPA